MPHNRKSIRLTNYDYSDGIYFVTICIGTTGQFLATNSSKLLKLTEIGKIVDSYWRSISDHFSHVIVDEYIIMPDHIHGILHFSKQINEPLKFHQFQKTVAGSLGVVIGQFKSSVKRWCNINGYRNFIWQRNFYEQIVKNDKELNDIRKYIKENPTKLTQEYLQ